MLPLSYVGLRKMVQAQCREHGVQEPRYPGMRPSLQWSDIGTWSHPRVLGQETITHQGMLPLSYVGLRKMVQAQCREHVEFKNHGVQEPPCLQWPDIGTWSHPRVLGQETNTHQGMGPLSYVRALGRWSKPSVGNMWSSRTTLPRDETLSPVVGHRNLVAP